MNRLDEIILNYLKSESLEQSSRLYLLLQSNDGNHYYKGLYSYDNGSTFLFEVEGHINNLQFHIVPDWDYNVDSYLLNDLEEGFIIIEMPLKSHSDHWFMINLIKDDIDHQKGLQEYLKYCKNHDVNINKLREFNLIDEDISKLSRIEEKYEQIKLFGKLVLFTPSRVNIENLPKGIYKYEVRHDDECKGIMCELSTNILVNHWGTILSDKPIKLDQNGYRKINEDKDVRFLNKKLTSINQYLSKQRNKSMER